MDILELEIPEVKLLRPRRFADARGFFSETYRRDLLAAAGIEHPFMQDNLSYSREAGTVRGLHLQRPPHAQAKLVSVITGAILDVAVDVRQGSPTFGRHVRATLDADEGAQLYVPEGFLHGFITLQADTHVCYKVSDVYAPECEMAVRWDDEALGIDWGAPAGAALLSAKDAAAPAFAALVSPFAFARRPKVSA